MPRRRDVPKRRILPDPKFHDVTVARFINKMMLGGKKSTAESIFYNALEIIRGKEKKEDPIAVFKAALEKIKPVIEVKSRRVGGSTYQVPVEIRGERREALGMRWLISYSRDRSEKTMEERLAGEVLDAYGDKGNTIKKKIDTHKMAEANKAFAHYRW